MATGLRVGLIGVGGIGSYHLSAIQQLEREGHVRLVAVADPGSERFPELKQALHGRGVRWHLDYRDLLREEAELDGVTIATPIPLHYEMTRASIERGIFVHLEKPPVPSIQQLEDLINADTQHRVSVGFQMIGSRCVQEVKNAILHGQLGEVSEIRVCGCWPRLDGYYNRARWAGRMVLDGEPVFDGPATNALAHLIHNIMFLAASEPEGFEVPVEVQGELYRARPIESYDVACLRGRFRSGVRFVVALAHATEEALPFRLEIRGTKGWARISEDGTLVEGSALERLECGESTQELLLKSHRAFVEFMSGERARTSTHMRDARGYVHATNGMLISSGQIHDIGADWIRTYRRENDRGFDVAGLSGFVENSFHTGRLFSEQGVPWAKPTSPISLENGHLIDFSKYSLAPLGELAQTSNER
jgi:predicted dehydrogenase